MLLSTPSFNFDVPLKATVSGVVFLKQKNFRQRYNGSKKFYVTPNGKNILSKPLPEKKEILKTSVLENPKVKKKRTYSINKAEFRRRLVTYVRCMPDNKKELYFFTVTFPKGTEDGLCYKFFNVWLTKLRQQGLIRNYIWVSERQKNGTIHFHIAIPHRMDAKFSNKEMRTVLVNASRKKEIAETVSFLQKYNGVHITKDGSRRAVNFAKKSKGIALIRYLTKYVTKNQTDKFTHLAWHNSRDFSAIFTGISFTIDEFVNVFKWKELLVPKSSMNTEFYQYHFWKGEPPEKLIFELKRVNQFAYVNN